VVRWYLCYSLKPLKHTELSMSTVVGCTTVSLWTVYRCPVPPFTCITSVDNVSAADLYSVSCSLFDLLIRSHWTPLSHARLWTCELMTCVQIHWFLLFIYNHFVSGISLLFHYISLILIIIRCHPFILGISHHHILGLTIHHIFASFTLSSKHHRLFSFQDCLHGVG